MPRVISRPGPFAVPYTYDLGATDVLVPQTIFAHWDGTAAAGSFLPAVAYYSQDGTRVMRVFPSTSVAAGGVADVSYAPFPGGMTSSASPASTAFHGCRALGFGPDFTGTLSKTIGSPIVTGVGTAFLSEVVGGGVYGARFYAANNETLFVGTIQSDTQFTATTNALATTAGTVATIDQGIPNATYTAVRYEGADLYDTDGYHFTASAALTGTVSKTAAGTAIAGAGTLFTAELSANQAISVPGGGGTDVLLVRAITSNTALTVWPNNLPAFTAAGQTAVRDPSVIGIPAGRSGYYAVVSQVDFRSSQDGSERHDVITVNGAPLHTSRTYADTETGAPTASLFETAYTTAMIAQLAAGDIVRDYAYQAFGSVVGLTPMYGLSLGMIGT